MRWEGCDAVARRMRLVGVMDEGRAWWMKMNKVLLKRMK